jgi:hypothetical protein
MAWQDELVATLRVMLGDLSATPTYSDDSLEQTLVVGAFQVSASIPFNPPFAASVSNVTLTPDPTLDATRNDSFSNLTTLRAAAILDRTEASLYARRGIIVKDGSSAIDLSKVADAKLRLLEKGWNAVYEDARWEYLYNRIQNVAGAAVLTPFRLFAWDTFGRSAFGNGDPRNRANWF